MSLATGDKSAFACGRNIVLKNAREGVLANGLWYEISPGYHYYALDALFSYEQSLRHYGRTRGIEDTLRAMLEAPLSFVASDGMFPAINDSGPSSITRYAAFYEMGEGLLGGFGSTLALLCREMGYERDTPEARLYGPDDEDAEPRKPACLNLQMSPRP